MLDGVKVKFDDRLLVQEARDAQLAQIFKQLLAPKGESLGVQRVEVILFDLISDDSNVLSK